MKTNACRLMLWAALIAVVAASARGEVLVLKSGGRVTGELLNPKRSSAEAFLIKTASGARVTIAAEQVQEKEFQSPAEIEYEKIRPRYADTVEDQWALAEWCQEHRLFDPQRKVHLGRILQLDPDHEGARHALGYSLFDGKWMTQEEVKRSRGERFYKGRWRLPQEIELMERKRASESAEQEWFGKIRMWRGWLGGNRGDQAHKNLMAINDPNAVKALAKGLESDGNLQVRKLYIEILANIDTPAAIAVLSDTAMKDPIEEIRLTCLDHLKKEKRPQVVAFFAGKLKSKDNILVRRAGIGLSYMGDPSAIYPLIQALVTVHKYKITKGSGNPNQQSHSFGNAPGGGGFSFGGGGTKIIEVPKANQEVLDALVQLTDGVNYQFNVPAWKAWFANQKKGAIVDARRD